MIEGKNILLGVTGGIAVYKAVDLASKLTREKANVKVVMTENACEFVSPLTFRAVTRQPVITKLFDSEAPVEHISLADWCDIAIIAPATANIIGKIAAGIADDLLTTTIMATTAAKVIVPAMNVNMWKNTLLQDNIRKLENLSHHSCDNYHRERSQNCYFIVPPATGRLACGYEGKGRFPQVREIVHFIKSHTAHFKDLHGKTILITAGACREHLDPMRYLSNLSSGKMGLALARAAWHRGANVILIHGVTEEEVPYFIHHNYSVVTSQEMLEITKDNQHKADIIIMNAAVTDFMPASTSPTKIKKDKLAGDRAADINLKMKPTVDILHELYRQKRANQIIMGFAAETNDTINNAQKKLKKCDLIAVNNISTAGKDDTVINVLSKGMKYNQLSGSKFETAHGILDILSRKTMNNQPF